MRPILRLAPLTLLSLLAVTSLATVGCLGPQAEAARSNDFRAWMEGWKGKPFAEFEKATNWRIASDRTMTGTGIARVVEYGGFRDAGTTDTTMTYHHVTSWEGNRPGITTTTGANQPVGELPANARVRTETLRIPRSRSGCRLFLWVDAQGLISSYRMDGSECFRETLEVSARR